MKYVLLLGLVLAVGILNQSFIDREEKIHAEAQRIAEEKKAQIFRALAKCLSEPSVITVADKPVADCMPRKR